MTKKILLGYFFGVVFLIRGQEKIFLNERTTVALFFKSEINTAIIGSEDFMVGYDTGGGQKYCTLKAIPNKIPSNLTIIASDGLVYEFLLVFQKKVTQFNYFIKKTKASNYETIYGETLVKNKESKGKKGEKKGSETPAKTKTNIENIYATIQKRKDKTLKRSFIKTDGVLFSLNNIYQQKGDFYFLMALQNKRNIPFSVGFLEIHKIASQGKKETYQENLIKIKAKHRFKKTISKKSENTFLLSIEVMGLNEQEFLRFSLREQNANFSFELNIDNEILQEAIGL